MARTYINSLDDATKAYISTLGLSMPTKEDFDRMAHEEDGQKCLSLEDWKNSQ